MADQGNIDCEYFARTGEGRKGAGKGESRMVRVSSRLGKTKERHLKKTTNGYGQEVSFQQDKRISHLGGGRSPEKPLRNERNKGDERAGNYLFSYELSTEKLYWVHYGDLKKGQGNGKFNDLSYNSLQRTGQKELRGGGEDQTRGTSVPKKGFMERFIKWQVKTSQKSGRNAGVDAKKKREEKPWDTNRRSGSVSRGVMERKVQPGVRSKGISCTKEGVNQKKGAGSGSNKPGGRSTSCKSVLQKRGGRYRNIYRRPQSSMKAVA